MKLVVDTSKLDEPKSGSKEENRDLTNCTRKDASWWEPGRVWAGGKEDRGMGVRSPDSGLGLGSDLR